ncbi:hypothetical protein E2C01_040817 [Portunus trituberculatus]|uniref:Uncharacterized protein n=1 Tax=Portunus trituberculatus TaxID=210409 RepID=A0A5B7FKS3_PORTR|nr:hypothetical protein [Portunus trituberculatus]
MATPNPASEPPSGKGTRNVPQALATTVMAANPAISKTAVSKERAQGSETDLQVGLRPRHTPHTQGK